MPIDVFHKTPLPPINVLIRLTAKDTKFLEQRIQQAIADNTGVNLILENMSGAACLISSKERGRQVSLNAYTGDLSYRVNSPMKGYTGPWSHIELVMDPKLAKEQLSRFLREILKEVEK